MIIFITLIVVIAAFALYTYGMSKEMERQASEDEELWSCD